jgi:hypothetical protein
MVRGCVTASRASGERRTRFAVVIKTGNSGKTFIPVVYGPASTPIEPANLAYVLLREVILLLEVETRWSSTFLMVDRFLERYLAIERFFQQNALTHLLPTHYELYVLGHIRSILAVIHSIQEVASAEKTPTLALVVPLYEELLDYLYEAKVEYPELAHALAAAIEKLTEYLRFARATSAYALAMGTCLGALYSSF